MDEEIKPGKIRGGLRLLHCFFRLSRLPLVGKRHPWIRGDRNDVRFLPINSDISLPENSPVPIDLLHRFIEEACHRVIVDYCGCRVGYGCKDYPHDIGCLLMGESALEVIGSHGREVTVEEAKEHAGKAVEAGLVPIVGKAHVDDFIYRISDRARLLTVCFCCECCCITRFLKDVPSRYLEPAYTRLEGISVRVNENCVGCGNCVEYCFMGAISILDKRASISERCRACGRCATVCPNGAIDIDIGDTEYLDKTYLRIGSHVKHD